MEKELLPIGTVVLLKGGTKKVMITGYYSIGENNETYDYNSCIFPEGFMENIFCLFNKDQIEEVFYKGLSDEEEKDFVYKIANNFDMMKSPVELEDSRKAKKGRPTNRNDLIKAPKSPTNPRSKSEMKAKYGINKSSLDNLEKFKRGELK